MKAIVWTKYGAPDGLQLREVPMPTPGEQEVLIRVHAATVSTPDTEFRSTADESKTACGSHSVRLSKQVL